MYMNFMKIEGVYKKSHHFVIQQFVCFISLKTKIKKYDLPLGFELGIASSPFFSVTICANDLTDVWYVNSR